MDNQDSSTVQHCGYCSEGHGGRCEGVSVENIQALLGTIESQKQTHDALLKKLSALEARNKELEAVKAKLLADWRISKDALTKIANTDYAERCSWADNETEVTGYPHEADDFYGQVANKALSSLSYTDSPSQQ